MIATFQNQEFRNLQQGKSSKMTPNRVKLLDSIGFIWKAPRGARRLPARPSGASPRISSAHPSSNPNLEGIKSNDSFGTAHVFLPRSAEPQLDG